MGKFIFFKKKFFGPLLSKIGDRTPAKFSRPIIFLFGRFCAIWPNFRPAGNSAMHAWGQGGDQLITPSGFCPTL
jgi:hypothetical protein